MGKILVSTPAYSSKNTDCIIITSAIICGGRMAGMKCQSLGGMHSGRGGGGGGGMLVKQMKSI